MTTNLIEAIHKTDVKLVEKAIAEGADVNAKAPKGEIPIHTAIVMEANLAGRDADKSQAYLEIINLLIQHGADVNAKDDQLNTPLHIIATGEYQNEKIFDILIDKGADLNAVDMFGNTPLHIAAQFMNGQFISRLVESGADTTIKDSLGRTAEDICQEIIKGLFTRSQNVDTGHAAQQNARRSEQKRARG